jgi:DNA-binding CsgD family transcriptional regulator
MDNSGTIYLGAQNEFGYITTNKLGQKKYISLLDKVPLKNKPFSDIWNVLSCSEGIVFLCNEALFQYKNNTIHVYLPKSKFVAAHKVADSILIQDDNFDIFTLKNFKLVKVIDKSQIRNRQLKSIHSLNDNSLLLITEDNGFRWSGQGCTKVWSEQVDNYLKANKVYCSLMLRNGYLAIGTVRSGLLILDNNRNVVQVINEKTGLQSNTVLALGCDNSGNIWVSTDIGLDYIEISQPLYKINKYYNLEGSVYSSLVQNGKLYVGTNSGLYVTKWNNQENPLNAAMTFKPLVEITSQVWNLYNIDQTVYVCTHSGTYKVLDKTAQRISPEMGTWNLCQLKKDSKYYIQGTYDGLVLYENVNKNLVYKGPVKGFQETSRVIETDHDGYIWMAHGYKGIFKLRLNSSLDSVVEVKFYDKSKGFPDNLFINLFKVRNEIIFGTEKGVYKYDKARDMMILHPVYKNMLGVNSHIRLLKEGINKDILFIEGPDMFETIGTIHSYEDGKYEITETPFQRLKGKLLPGFENVTFLDNGLLLFGSKSGIVLFDGRKTSTTQKSFQAIIANVKCTINDSIIYGFSQMQNTINNLYDTISSSLPYSHNALNFSYSSSFYEDLESNLYSCFLEGFDKQWSIWEKNSEKQYTNLPNGNYKFHVKAKNIYGFESKEDLYSFTIERPWYKKTWAYLLYVSLLLPIGWLVIKGYKARLEIERKRLSKIHLDEIRKANAKFLYDKLQTEKQIRQLAEEKHKADSEHKDSALAASTLHLMQLNDTLTQVKEEVQKVLITLEPDNRKVFKSIITTIDDKMVQNDSWDSFELHLNKIHNDFLKRLKAEFPDLNPRDIRLCAYLRLNLSSKEIASLLGISVRGIESIRYRVRKKVNLKTNEGLTEFLLNY